PPDLVTVRLVDDARDWWGESARWRPRANFSRPETGGRRRLRAHTTRGRRRDVVRWAFGPPSVAQRPLDQVDARSGTAGYRFSARHGARSFGSSLADDQRWDHRAVARGSRDDSRWRSSVSAFCADR